MEMQPNFAQNAPLEKSKESKNIHHLEIGEIIEKLDDKRMDERFNQELWNLESGAEFDEMWLATYHDSLAYWKSNIISMPVTKESEDTLDEITRRMALILEALEKKENRITH